MDCTTTIELLPWFLNGSLDAEERRQVEAHLAVCENCRGELEQTRIAGAIYSAHPPPEALVDHAAGREPAGFPRTLIERHVAACATCAEELSLLAESHGRTVTPEEEPEEEAEGGPSAVVLTGPWTAARWRRLALAASVAGLVAAGGLVWTLLQRSPGAELAARLEQADERSRELAAENRRLETAGTEARERVDALAAEVETAAGQAAELEERLERERERERIAELESREPRLLMGVPVVTDLRRAETVLRDAPGGIFGEEEELPAVRRSAGMAVLSLPLHGGQGIGEVRLEVLDEAGRVVLSERGPPPADPYSYVVGLPASRLAPGRHTLRLSAVGDGEGEVLGTYALEVE